MNIRLATTNSKHIHNPNPGQGYRRLLRKARWRWPLGLDVIAIQEGHGENITTALKKVRGYRPVLVTGKGVAGDELPFLIKCRLKLETASFRLGSRAVPENPVNRSDRGVHALTLSAGKHLVYVVNTHCPVQASHSHEAYRDHIEAVVTTAMVRRAAGYLVFVLADANSGEKEKDGLQRALRKQGFEVFNHNIDCIAYDPAKVKLTGSLIVPASQMNSDHDALAARFKIR